MLNLDSITASVLTGLVKDSFSKVTGHATGAIKTAWLRVFEDFGPYMQQTFDRNRYVRILSQKDKDEYIYDIYVGPTFTSGTANISDKNLIEKINEGRNCVIVGNGGAGKTFFMRHLWLTVFTYHSKKAPIFIELRKLNELPTADLFHFIRKSISMEKLPPDVFDHFCMSGAFLFIFDGFDEVVSHHKEPLQSQILLMQAHYRNCTFVVSSRYEDRFSGWQSFEVYETAPFNFKQIKKLIKRVPFDKDSKRLFSEKLTQEFYDEHVEFLSNPLLAVMMMMTFREHMEIPKRMNIFYDQAFNTLYHWHDATKAYRREKSLDIIEFQKSFSTFCLISYFEERYEFTKSEIEDLISKSSSIAGIETDSGPILHDYQESVNLIKQEGLQYTFIHRSFQEYFTAYALIRLPAQSFGDAIKRISSRSNDNVMSMCYEMDKSLVLMQYIAPLISRLQTAGFFDFHLKPFEYGKKCGISYSSFVESSGDPEEPHHAAVSTSLPSLLQEFMSVSSKLLGFEGNHQLYAHNTFITSDVYRALDLPSSHLRHGMAGQVNIVCENNSIVFKSAAGEDAKTNDAILEIYITAHDQIVSTLEANFKLAMNKIGVMKDTWERELNKIVEQTKTLDQILRLTAT
ncbi:NACHT domain-containing protein [Rhizobium sp. AN5]|uniref:NACHT domain-containing protein n=1 Tax=Rhizobium sp. AN5 TaxID=1855304 RepID=UPI000BD3957E|nr:NACHT domain-containing protein [Rhizobium sp. AN5]SOC93572.1 NACHT domain-containing protein [Rhizobium sp. AN5]